MTRRWFVATPSGTEARRLYGSDMALRLRAETHEQAAMHAARRLHGRTTMSSRQTGTAGRGGVFAFYRQYLDGWTSIGANIRITEVQP